MYEIFGVCATGGVSQSARFIFVRTNKLNLFLQAIHAEPQATQGIRITINEGKLQFSHY